MGGEEEIPWARVSKTAHMLSTSRACVKIFLCRDNDCFSRPSQPLNAPCLVVTSPAIPIQARVRTPGKRRVSRGRFTVAEQLRGGKSVGLQKICPCRCTIGMMKAERNERQCSGGGPVRTAKHGDVAGRPYGFVCSVSMSPVQNVSPGPGPYPYRGPPPSPLCR
jgi:hypothetical protein